MTTFFVDPELGNDASAGTSFATAWKTISNGATAPRLNPGDEIRVKASPPATNMGQSAVWTNRSNTVTLASAVTQNITACETAFTSDTLSCTTSADGNGSNRREGANSAHHNISAAVNIGSIISHFPLPATLDLSTFQQISFALKWQLSGAFPTNAMRIDLCSDLAGTTPVNSFLVDINTFGYSQWNVLTLDNGAPLGNNINSIAIVAAQTWNVTGDFWFDNILACKAVSAADSLSLNSLISKNTAGEGWWAIRSINGTTVKLDASTATVSIDSPGYSQGYFGLTETVPIFKRQPFNGYVKNADSNIFNKAGTLAAPIVYSGGWDRVNMSSQVDISWFDGVVSTTYNIFNWAGSNYVQANNFGAVRGAGGFNCTGISPSVSNCQATACDSNGFNIQPGTGVAQVLGCSSYQGTGRAITISNGIVAIDDFKSVSGYYGANFGSSTLSVSGTLSFLNSYVASYINACGGSINSIVANGSSADNLNISTSRSPLRINSINSQNAGQGSGVGYGLYLQNVSGLKIYNLTTAGNATGSVNLAGCNIPSGEAVIHNWNYADAVGTFLTAFQNGVYYDYRLKSHNESGIVGNHVVRTDGGLIQSETGANRHTMTGLAWKLSFSSDGGLAQRGLYYPMSLSVAKIAVIANSLVTVSGWVLRSSAAQVGARLRVNGAQLAGIGNPDVVANATHASDGAYEQLTLSFTPTEGGVFEVFFDAWPLAGLYTGIAWIDDMTIVQ